MLIVLIALIGVNVVFETRRRRTYQDHLKKVQGIMGNSDERYETSLALQKEMVAKLGEIKSLLENRKA